MSEAHERWAGIHTSMQTDPGNDGYNGIYRVSFVWGLMHARGYGGEPQKVRTTALVRLKAESDGTILSVLHYEAPEQPLPGFDRQDFESKALEVVETWVSWHKRLSGLVGQVEQWGRELGWATRRIEKKLADPLIGPHQAPALLLQEDIWRVLLEPVGRSAPGVEGIVDLYLMPAYDDIASLLYYGGRWNLHYLFHGDQAAPTIPEHQAPASIREAEGVPLSKEALQRVLDEMKQHAA